jgi:hypothetical protein
MPVVINEFEVIAEKPQPLEEQRSAREGEAQTEQKKTLRPVDVLQIQEWQQRRMERIHAD